MIESVSSTPTWISRIKPWHGRSILSGIAGSVIASACCLPAATAIALGLGLSTVASVGQLLAYQRLFQIAGLAFGGIAVWWIGRRSGTSCSIAERAQMRDRVLLYVFGAFAVGFAFLNLVVIPLLER